MSLCCSYVVSETDAVTCFIFLAGAGPVLSLPSARTTWVPGKINHQKREEEPRPRLENLGLGLLLNVIDIHHKL
jgi:hypothetical protein